MNNFFDMFFNFYSNIFNKFSSVTFNISGYSLSLTNIIVGCLILSIAISVFWRGAKG